MERGNDKEGAETGFRGKKSPVLWFSDLSAFTPIFDFGYY